MNLSRRDFLTLAGGAAVAFQLPLGELPAALAQAGGPTRWQQRAEAKRRAADGITWLTHEPIEFILRRGQSPPSIFDEYRRMCDPANIRKMAAAGVKWGRIFFYKGFGLEFEKTHIAQAKAVADLMHQLGMKVSLYVGGTMFTETLYREEPKAQDWEQRDSFGRPVPYGNQTFRHFACPNSMEYRDYIKRVLHVGVIDLRADELAFDNFVLQAEPASCRCPRCQKKFTEFIAGRYPTPDALKGRFGVTDARAVKLNPWKNPGEPGQLATLDDPVLQEWTRFRCQSLADSAGDLYGYVKSLNPDVACLLNIKGQYSFNRYWAAGVYHPMFKDRIDIMAFDTGGYDARMDPQTGALVSQIRSYKVARGIGCSCEDSFADEIKAAVHMSFGYQKPLAGNIAAPWGSEAHNVFTPMLEFFREYNDRYYRGTKTVANVAVLRNWPSMAYSINATSVPVTLMEQVLIQYKVPFDILFDEQMERLPDYSTVILANQECMSEAQLQTLLDFTRNGGTLVVAGNTAQFDETRKERKSNPLQPARAEGKGKIVYIAEIIRADTARPRGRAGATAQMAPTQWVLPKNHADIFQAVAGSFPDGLPVTSEAPLTSVMELMVRPETRETILHVVNFDTKNPLKPFAMTAKPQFPSALKSVTYFSPDADDPAPLDFQIAAGRTSFTVPATRVYAMMVIAHA